jgi:hypothetical protein
MSNGKKKASKAKAKKVEPKHVGSSKKNVNLPALLDLEDEVKRFVTEHRISCPEAICQNDDVIVDAYEFIENLVNIVGYYEEGDDDGE